jgi:pimeloyl-ACP methyl ester carboxylesterase
VLEQCAQVTIVMISDAGHFTLNEKPGLIADVVIEAIASATPA